MLNAEPCTAAWRSGGVCDEVLVARQGSRCRRRVDRAHARAGSGCLAASPN